MSNQKIRRTKTTRPISDTPFTKLVEMSFDRPILVGLVQRKSGRPYEVWGSVYTEEQARKYFVEVDKKHDSHYKKTWWLNRDWDNSVLSSQ